MPTEEELIEEGERISEEIGRAPSSNEFDELSEDYSAAQCLYRFGTWSNYRDAAGMDVHRTKSRDDQGRVEGQTHEGRDKQYSKTDVVRAIRKADNNTEGWLRKDVFNRLSEMSADTCIARFGSWCDARVAAGIEPVPENQVGENNYNWEGGKRVYTGCWDQKRELVLERDEHECVLCGTTQTEHTEKFSRSLEVHHIIPYRKFDNDERAHDPSNLITLCKDCHLEWEGIPLRPIVND